MKKSAASFIVFFFYASYIVAQTHAGEDQAQIKAARAAINQAIAGHDPAGIAAFMMPNYSIVTGRGAHVSGRDSVLAFWKQTFAAMPGVIYVRTPIDITISRNDSLAWETGKWTAEHSYSRGGNYSAMWRKTDQGWKMEAELFVSLHPLSAQDGPSFPGKVPGQPLIHVNEQRIESRIRTLGLIGDSTAGSLRRVAYGRGDISARKYIISLMESAGLIVTIDAAGNIIGKRKGKDPSLPSIAFGSHTDAVPNGGIYDGDLGVIAAIECIEVLNENHLITNHPLEVIDFVDEEGGLSGSHAMLGELSPERLNAPSNSGKTIGQGIRDLGGDLDHLDKAVRKKGEMQAFLELHIEQGGNLEREHRDIGVVEGIVGISDWNIVVTGKTNHAGTTPMSMRKDALVIAARVILLINEIVLNIPGRQVATVGKISVQPGATNVIPGIVTMNLDLRDLSQKKSDSVFGLIRQKTDSLATATGTSIRFIPVHQTLPAVTDQGIQDKIASSARELGLTSMFLPSGAGHDTQDMARISAVGMIFVPSKGGISHSPEEYTSPKDMANGASVLLRTILKIDQ